VISGLKITSKRGDCVQIINSTNVTIKNSEIGPCGQNGTTSPSRGVFVSGGSGIGIYDNYIHVENLASGCCDSHDGILTTNTSNVTIQGNVIAFGETNIEATNGSANITVTGNFLLNPRGPFPRGQQFQSTLAQNITVTNNYSISTLKGYTYPADQEDAFNFWQTNTFSASGNYVIGGFRPSGCGLFIDDRSNFGTFKNNILSNTGQCGIGVGDGVGHLIDSNKVLNLTPVAGGGNTAIYVWKQYNENPQGCGSSTSPYQIVVSYNIADELKPDGYNSGWWDGGGCDPTKLVNNVWNQTAYSALFPMTSKYPPPAIPPEPSSCVAVSPYSTQTSLPPCAG
jgi:Right handed beta helix region